MVVVVVVGRVYMIEHFPFSAHGLLFLSGAWINGSWASFSSINSRILFKRESKKANKDIRQTTLEQINLINGFLEQREYV